MVYVTTSEKNYLRITRLYVVGSNTQDSIMANMIDEIAKIKEKYADVPESELKKAFKQAWKPVKQSRKEENGAVAAKMVELVNNFENVSIAIMKRSLVVAWKAKHPNGITKATRQPSEWHKFMRENHDIVIQEHPNSSQHERIKILGVMYKAAKDAAAAANPPPNPPPISNEPPPVVAPEQASVPTGKGKTRK